MGKLTENTKPMLTSKKRIFQLIVLFIAFPTIALANAGSPMMWFGIFHLLFLNFCIGITESAILRRFKLENNEWMIILANYVSMFVGLYFIAPHFSSISGNRDFWGGNTRLGEYHVKGFIVGMLSAYLATLVIELPFALYAVKVKVQKSQILIPFLVANTVTNVAMITIYFLITGLGEKW